MNVNIIQTGSRGNATILTDKQGNQLLIDCGIPYESIATHIKDFNSLTVVITHEHGDHTLCLQKFANFGVTILCGKNVREADNFGTKNVTSGQMVITNNKVWQILPIKVPHGDCECYSYIIYNTAEKKRVFWATDLQRLPNVDGNYDLMAIECNYSLDKTLEIACSGDNRTNGYANHLEFGVLLDWLKIRKNKPTRLCIIHLSNSGLFDEHNAVSALKNYCGQLFVGKKKTIMEV